MCISAALAIASTASSAVGAVGAYQSSQAQAGEAARRGANAMSEGFREQELRALEARQIKAASIAEANNIKRQAMNMRAALASAQAGSGVVIGEGSAQAAMDQIDTLASADVLAALYQGSDKAVTTKQQGQMAGEAGHNSYLSGLEQAKSIARAGKTKFFGDMLGVAGSAAQIGYGLQANKTGRQYLRTTGVFEGDLPTRGGQ